MAVAFDAFSENGSNSTADPISWTHTPVGTPRGVLVFVNQNSTGLNDLDGVTYGGVAMSAVSSSPLFGSGGEPATIYGFFLGSGIPTGAQTVSVDVNSVTAAKRASCFTLTASANTEVVSVATINTDPGTNPSTTVSLSGRTCFVAAGIGSGQGAVADLTPLANWTSRVEPDFGSRTGAVYSYDVIGSSDVTAGWTQTAEDAYMLAVAISEVTGGGSKIPVFLSQFRRRRVA